MQYTILTPFVKFVKGYFIKKRKKLQKMSFLHKALTKGVTESANSVTSFLLYFFKLFNNEYNVKHCDKAKHGADK